ncbi:hypothetical protein SCLCIDRAFT_1215832 [Scleroderma citrinum Foug A]|uniref:Uncharacterized protein n=1 Tax=Scleroderma citrinum Foug A TaxID=1036808 RepID=A0A0C3DZT7_9AGAM|nr:hypothetical protein SCLCIDRAFT_1215832 [Scleroderma citrinum Foug A]
MPLGAQRSVACGVMPRSHVLSKENQPDCITTRLSTHLEEVCIPSTNDDHGRD